MRQPQSMCDRLMQARINAGFRTATAAIEKLKWNGSAYRAHENGQNNFSVTHAEKYAKAYKVTAAWLLVGEGEGHKPGKSLTKKINRKYNKNECPEKIYSLAISLRDDPENVTLLQKLSECVEVYASYF